MTDALLRPLASATLLSLLTLASCTDVAPEPQGREVILPEPLTDEPIAPEIRARVGVDPALEEALAAGEADDELTVEVRVSVPAFRAPPIAPMVATLEVAGGDPIYTLDGRTVDEAAMADRAASDRRAIDEGLVRQFEARRERVDAAIRDAGIEEAVEARGDTWFRARLPRSRAQALLRDLEGEIAWARLPSQELASTDLRDDLHDANNNGNPYDDGEDGALEKIGVIGFAHAYGMRGQGVGIWHNEGYASYHKRPEFNDADLVYLTSAHWQPVKNGGECRYNDECCSGICTTFFNSKVCMGGPTCPCGMDKGGNCVGDVRSQEHSTLVALIAHEAAPDATIYHTATTSSDCMINSVVDLQASSPVYVGAQSWSYEGGGATDNDYNVIGYCNAEFDDYIRSSRIAHFHSSGNSNANYVGSPARAFNVIGVGNYNHVTGTMTAESGYLNPSTLVEKPEIVAPGTDVTAAPGWTRTGSSISSPMAAGFAADMMSGSSFFRNQPQAIKAYLIAGAHNVNSGTGFGFGSAKDGAGRVDYLDSYFYCWGKVWNGGNGDYFDANHKIVEARSLTAGKRYTIAISWLASGSWAFFNSLGFPYVLDPEPLDQKMKLTVSRVGVGTWTAYIAANNFQLVDFTVPAGGTGAWTITIERMYNAGVGDVNLALTVGEHG